MATVVALKSERKPSSNGRERQQLTSSLVRPVLSISPHTTLQQHFHSNMKFAIAVVCTLALAMSVQSSIIPLGITQIAGNGLAYTAVSGPLPISVPGAISINGSPIGHIPVAVQIAAGAPPTVVAAPPAAVVVGAPAPDGTYVAQTRGAVHTAPLPGHITSAANINVAPAPGTV